MQARKLYRKFPEPAFPISLRTPVRSTPLLSYNNLHKHNCIELFFILEGEYAVTHNGTEYAAKQGDLCIFLPGHSHCVRAVADTSVYRVLYFLPEAICMNEDHFFQQQFGEPLRMGILSAPYRISGEELNPRLFSALGQLDEKSDNISVFRFLMGLCLDLLPHCAQNGAGTGVNSVHPLVNLCLVYMRQNLNKKITLAELAAHVHLNPNYLNSLFKKETGETIFTRLNYMRIRKARKLLEQTRLPVSQVAEQTGFASTDFFTRKFKVYTGMSPSKYRKQLEQK